MRCDQRLGQLPGGAEGGDRVGVTPARHFEAPASVVEMHPDGRFDVRSQGARGVPEPPLTLRQPPLGDHRSAEHRVGHGDERLVAPAVLSGQVDRLPASLRSARIGPEGGEFRPMRKGGELEIRPPDPARQSHALLEVLVRVLETERPDFGDAEADQRQRSQVFPQTELRFVRRVDGGEQPVRRLSHRRQVPALPGQVQLQDREHDLQASAPVCGYRRGPLDGQRKLPFCLLQRSPGQFGRRGQRGELRVLRHDPRVSMTVLDDGDWSTHSVSSAGSSSCTTTPSWPTSTCSAGATAARRSRTVTGAGSVLSSRSAAGMPGPVPARSDAVRGSSLDPV